MYSQKIILISLIIFGSLVIYPGIGPCYAYDVSSGFAFSMGQDIETGGAGELEFGSVQTIRLTFGNVAEPLRFEYELFYRDLDAEELKPTSALPVSASGNLTQMGLSLNFYERLIALRFVGMVPYWGVGAGGSWLSFDSIKAGSNFDVDDSAGVFNYQFMIGLEHGIGNPLSLSIDLRWVDFGSTGLENQASTESVQLSPTVAPELGIQLRYKF